MRNNLRLFISLYILGVVSVANCLSANETLKIETDDGRFVLGRVSARPEAALADLKAMTGYLQTVLPSAGSMIFDEVVVSSLAEMIPLLRNGTVDVISETPIGAVELESTAGAEIILHEWKKGVAQYAGLIIVHRESGIKQLEDLRGKVMAFEDPGSTSGFFIPLAALKQKKLKIIELDDRHDTPASDSVGYVFAGVELSIASLVARKIVDAGAISDLNWNDLKEVPAGFRERLDVIYTSDFVPRSTVVIRAGFPRSLKSELMQTLVVMHKNNEGLAAMKKYHGVARYKIIEGQVVHQFDNVRKLHQRIRGFIN